MQMAEQVPAVVARADQALGTDRPLPVPETEDFVELYRFHYRRLVRALSLAGAPDRAEDLAQEAFARTYRHWRRVRQGTNAAGYVYRVGFRLLARRGLPTTPFDDVPVEGRADSETGAVLSADLARALELLPPRRRACVVLCWCLDLSVTAAAESLGIAPGTVRKQLELARPTLQAAIGEVGDGESPG